MNDADLLRLATVQAALEMCKPAGMAWRCKKWVDLWDTALASGRMALLRQGMAAAQEERRETDRGNAEALRRLRVED